MPCRVADSYRAENSITLDLCYTHSIGFFRRVQPKGIGRSAMIASKDRFSSDPRSQSTIKGAPDGPPTTNRGVDIPPSQTGPYGPPYARGVDYLTITTGPEAAGWLLRHSDLLEEGRPSQGFQRSENRIFGSSRQNKAQTTWRKYDPYSPSRLWGLNYESWLCAGPPAHAFAELLTAGPAHDMRASRVDIAWDYLVMETDDADTFADTVRSHCTNKGLKFHDQGPEDNHTKYIGSRASSRRIRVYRKDRQQPQFFPNPVLRLELELKGDTAAAWWPVFCRDSKRGFAAAASHLYDMTGIKPQETGEIPPQPVQPELKATDTLFHALDQYGVYLDAAIEAGIDVPGLSKLRRESSHSRTQFKYKKALQEFITYGIAETEEFLSMRIA